MFIGLGRKGVGFAEDLVRVERRGVENDALDLTLRRP